MHEPVHVLPIPPGVWLEVALFLPVFAVAQGLWWLRSQRFSGRRADWTGTPVRLLDTDIDPLPWFANGGCGPSFHYGDTEADRDTMYVFFTGTYASTGWLKVAAARLARGRRHPVPAPFSLATGRIAIPRMKASPGTSLGR